MGKEDIFYWQSERRKNLAKVSDALRMEGDVQAPRGMTRDRFYQIVFSSVDVGSTSAYYYLRSLLGKNVLTEFEGCLYLSDYFNAHRTEIWEHFYPAMPKERPITRRER